MESADQFGKFGHKFATQHPIKSSFANQPIKSSTQQNEKRVTYLASTLTSLYAHIIFSALFCQPLRSGPNLHIYHLKGHNVRKLNCSVKRHVLLLTPLDHQIPHKPIRSGSNKECCDLHTQF